MICGFLDSPSSVVKIRHIFFVSVSVSVLVKCLRLVLFMDKYGVDLDNDWDTANVQ